MARPATCMVPCAQARVTLQGTHAVLVLGPLLPCCHASQSAAMGQCCHDNKWQLLTRVRHIAMLSLCAPPLTCAITCIHCAGQAHPAAPAQAQPPPPLCAAHRVAPSALLTAAAAPRRAGPPQTRQTRSWQPGFLSSWGRPTPPAAARPGNWRAAVKHGHGATPLLLRRTGR